MPSDFDIASAQYDSTFTFSNIGKAQRSMVYKYLNAILEENMQLSILELNCGTGEDAIHFAKLGHYVLATDISEGMIKVAKAKTNSKNVIFKIQDIAKINETTFSEKFDIIFSNFGGLNCLSNEQLEVFLKTSVHLLKPYGKIIGVIMPKKCLWERVYFSLKGDFKKGKRRQTYKAVNAHIDGVNVDTWYYNPKDIVAWTQPFYNIKKIKPIGLTIPPSYLENSFLSKRPFLSIFKSIDTLITGSFWAKYGDHFLIELQKR